MFHKNCFTDFDKDIIFKNTEKLCNLDEVYIDIVIERLFLETDNSDFDCII